MEQNKVTMVNNKEVVKLGDGDVFIKRTSTGAIKAVKGRIRLEEKEGHLCTIQGKTMITAAGYNEMNKIASVNIITPEKITLPDGTMVVNPYPIIDKESGSIDKIWVKKMAIGFSPIGNLVITSSTLLYDPRMYLIQDLMKKVQKNKNAGRLCNEKSITENERKSGGEFFKIHGSLGIWANTNDMDVIKCMDTFIGNILNAERKAQTIAERNCLKKHPALAKVYVNATGSEYNHSTSVDVIGYNHDLTREDLFKLSQIAERGEDVSEYNGIIIDNVNANIIDEVTDEDSFASRVNDDDIKEPETVLDVQDSSAEETENVEPTLEILMQTRDILGAKEFDQLIAKTFKKKVEKLTPEELTEALKLVSAAVDAKDNASTEKEVY